MYRNLKFLHMTDFFLHGHRPCVRDKYQVCPWHYSKLWIASKLEFTNKQALGNFLRWRLKLSEIWHKIKANWNMAQSQGKLKYGTKSGPTETWHKIKANFA